MHKLKVSKNKDREDFQYHKPREARKGLLKPVCTFLQTERQGTYVSGHMVNAHENGITLHVLLRSELLSLCSVPHNLQSTARIPRSFCGPV